MMKSLLKKWQDYKDNPSNEPKLGCKYYFQSSSLSIEILPALVFWQFVRREVNVEIRKEFCKKFLQDNNDLISLVAHIESLPDKVWRKLLWVENIDYVDYESTLRRINRDQEHAIIEAYYALDLNEPVMPKSFLKNFWDLLKFYLGLITPKKLLAGPYGEKARYFTKGAWAFNLLSIDFGFSLYPHGKNDDTQISNKKFMRFLSIKEHINDFIVNKEDGIYWLLYRSARSNFVWFPNKKVKLSDHVCPGFWKTLLIHLLFWIVSPIGFISMMIVWLNTGSFPLSFPALLLNHASLGTEMLSVCILIAKCIGNTGMILLTFFMPLWLAASVIKIIVVNLNGFIEKIAPSVGKFLVKVWEVASRVIDFIVDVFTTEAAKLIGKIIWKSMVVLFYIFVATGVIYISTLAWPHLVQFYHFLTVFVKDLLLGISNHPYSTAWSILALVVIMFTSSIMFSTRFEDREYAKYDKVIRLSIWIWIAVSVIMGYLTISKENIFEFGPNFSLMTVYILNFFAFAFVTVLGMATMEINMDTVEKRVDSKKKASYINLDMYKGQDYDRVQAYLLKFRNLILRNKWLLSVDFDSYEKSLGDLNKIIDKNYGFQGKEKDRFLFIVLPVINPDLLIKLSKTIPKNIVFEVDKFHFLYCLCRGLSYKEAFKETVEGMSINNEKNARKRKRQERREARAEAFAEWIDKWINEPFLSFLKILSWPFIKLGYGIAHVAKWLYKFSLTLKDVWSLFNERCPYISESKFLE